VIKAARKIKYKWVLADNKQWKNDDILCSVVIPYFNRGDTIGETIDSLEKQTIRNFEIIIVNDGSTDDASVTKLEEIKLGYPKIKIINQKNSGVAAARNNGIKYSKGKYILCLDSDDALVETCIEKMVILLETKPEISLVTTDMYMFGKENKIYKETEYDARELINNNMVITAAMYRKTAWEAVGGYTPNIGYEDWEFWIKLAESGYWGKRIPEALFKYRTAEVSRYTEDKSKHQKNYFAIRDLHPRYNNNIRKQFRRIRKVRYILNRKTAFVNLSSSKSYAVGQNKGVLIFMPWMTFGGAETLVSNFCNELYDKFDLTFMTGLDSENEWEYKFQEITPRIYHLTNIIDDKALWVEFVSNYITTRNIEIMHIVHNGFVFDMLAELKSRHPNLKVILTMFNDRVEYFEQSVLFSSYIDIYSSDNLKVANHYKRLLPPKHQTICIPNGIDSDGKYNLNLYNRNSVRASLGLAKTDIACFFVGRLSSEKNPNIFIDVARKIIESGKYPNLKFFIIGDGVMNSQITGSVKQINNDKLRYIGYKAEVAEFLSAADVFILPSSVEGFPLSLLEAMAMNLVSIASDVGAVAEVLDDGITGFVVEPGSAEEIISILGKLHENPKLLLKIGKNARIAVEEKYSAEKLGENYTKLYMGEL